jgi:trehalose-6-phosphatase
VNKKLARAAILEAAASLGDVRIVGGKQVVNLLPKGAPDKGKALERERERLCCDTAIYVGDDETDEDVFALDQPTRLLSIRVERSAPPPRSLVSVTSAQSIACCACY